MSLRNWSRMKLKDVGTNNKSIKQTNVCCKNNTFYFPTFGRKQCLCNPCLWPLTNANEKFCQAKVLANWNLLSEPPTGEKNKADACSQCYEGCYFGRKKWAVSWGQCIVRLYQGPGGWLNNQSAVSLYSLPPLVSGINLHLSHFWLVDHVGFLFSDTIVSLESTTVSLLVRLMPVKHFVGVSGPFHLTEKYLLTYLSTSLEEHPNVTIF